MIIFTLLSIKTKLLDTVIMRRKVYAESISKGLGVIEMKPRNVKAIAEFEHLVEEIYRRNSQ